jgi:Sec-independent protein secretion pathway component TatC
MLLAAPLTLLYIVSIGVAWAFGRGKRPSEAQ